MAAATTTEAAIVVERVVDATMCGGKTGKEEERGARKRMRSRRCRPRVMREEGA
jgi:hypothetical protein